MTPAEIILYMFILTPGERKSLKAKAKVFCEKHLIAWDEYDPQTIEYLKEIEQAKEKDENYK